MGKGEETKEAIIREALSTASRFGLDQLSIGTLARDVGLSKSGLFAHFGSKEGLQLQVLQRSIDLFIEGVVRPALRQPRGLARYRALMEGWIAWQDRDFQPGGCVFDSASREFHDRPGPIRDFVLDGQERWRQTLRRASELAVSEGQLRADLALDQFVFESIGIVTGMLHYKRLFADENATARAQQALEDLIEHELATARR